ncbi:MAG: hypothetical protein U5L96_19240 [Owenweeksia sp.]|nr:hypothetical protein [Owenweeksia sp.]
MIENFMDYADDVCQNIITGQKNVMRAALETAGTDKSSAPPPTW